MVPCSWECSVALLSFASQRLWCLELNSYLERQQLRPNCYQSSSLSSYMVLQGCITPSWQIQDGGKICVQNFSTFWHETGGSRKRTAYWISYVYYVWFYIMQNYYLTLQCLNYSKKNVHFAHFDLKFYPVGHYGAEKGTLKVLVWNPVGPWPLGRPSSRWNGNIKIYFTGIGWVVTFRSICGELLSKGR
jgi:hypothetical protein